jgi:hypothetical protein
MALAWVVVALLEWTAWLDQPHYGRGLPPRYYVPNTALPPPQPVVQRGARYPVPRPRRAAPGTDDAPTFVAPAAEWSAELGAWPLLDAPGEDTVVALPGDGDEVRVVPLPPPLAGEETVAYPPPAAPAQPARVAAAAGLAAAAPARERARPEEGEQAGRAPDRVQLPAPEHVEALVSHRVDPLAAPARSRFRFRRGREEHAVQVPDGPPPDRRIPERTLEQARAARR